MYCKIKFNLNICIRIVRSQKVIKKLICVEINKSLKKIKEYNLDYKKILIK